MRGGRIFEMGERILQLGGQIFAFGGQTEAVWEKYFILEDEYYTFHLVRKGGESVSTDLWKIIAPDFNRGFANS